MIRNTSLAQFIRRIPRILLWCLLSVLFTNVFGIFTPVMPGVNDESWPYGLNQAVSQKLAFGKDIIFTLGPYSSVYSHSYHPATVWMMTLGLLLLDILCLACFVWLVKDAHWRWPLILACILVVPECTQDAFLFSLPLLASLVVLKLQLISDGEALNKISTRIFVVLAFACLGLLPLVKGTFILMTAGFCLAGALFLLGQRRIILALLCLLAPGISMVVLWIASGQHLMDLPSYFSSIKFIIYGYSEAMALGGPLWEILVFVLGAAVILLSIATEKNLATIPKTFLLLIYALFLFLGFKEGFVRQDDHVWIAMNCLAIGSLFLTLLNIEAKLSFHSWRLLAVALFVTTLMTMKDWKNNFVKEVTMTDAASKQFTDGSRGESFERLRKDLGGRKLILMMISSAPTVLSPWDLKMQSWRLKFEQSKVELNKSCGLDFTISGTADLYSPFELHCLLAKGYRWNPRPVIDSYSAYTPELIRLNEQHLRIGSAPDDLVFRLGTIDGRFLSLNDGLSWPAMLDNYTVAGYSNQWVHLARRALPVKTVSRYIWLGKFAARIGEEVPVPTSSGPIVIVVDAGLSAAGKMIGVFYKDPSLTLTVTMEDGERLIYRVNADMMKTGFILSPLVTTNEGFIRLFDPRAKSRQEETVQKIGLNVSDGLTACWKKNYTVAFEQYEY